MTWFFLFVFFFFWFFTQSSNAQICESNQVHSWLWLETYAAFLSSDLITRLFSCKVSGVGPSRSHIVFSRTPCGGQRFINCPTCTASVNCGHPLNPKGMQSDLGATQRAIYYVSKNGQIGYRRDFRVFQNSRAIVKGTLLTVWGDLSALVSLG